MKNDVTSGLVSQSRRGSGGAPWWFRASWGVCSLDKFKAFSSSSGSKQPNSLQRVLLPPSNPQADPRLRTQSPSPRDSRSVEPPKFQFGAPRMHEWRPVQAVTGLRRGRSKFDRSRRWWGPYGERLASPVFAHPIMYTHYRVLVSTSQPLLVW